MRHSAFLLGIALFCAGTAGAQALSSPQPVADSSAADAVAASQPSAEPQLFALANPSNAPSANADAADPQGPTPQTQSSVQGVFPAYKWQGFLGYTFVYFNEGTNYSKPLNGFNMALDYYPHTGAFGVEGEVTSTFGSQANHLAELWAGMGGARYRFAAPRGTQIWVHGLVGGTKFVPQTAFGNGDQTGLAYEVGGGIDIGAFNHRFAYRFSGDMLGTRVFGQNQFSPKVTAGIIFKF